VTLSEGLKALGDRAFSGCTALRAVQLPDSIETLGNGVFYGC
jgi:hypothetical protein